MHAFPGEEETNSLWGSYSIPQDNPYSEDKDLEPEVWALGLKNPWRCSFDAERPEYFLCGDVGEVKIALFFYLCQKHTKAIFKAIDNNSCYQTCLTFEIPEILQDRYEEVDIITKGGNYGWPTYEGLLLFKAEQTSGGNTSANSTNMIFPALGYKHSDVSSKTGSAAISGGYFYRSMTDPCMYGR